MRVKSDITLKDVQVDLSPEEILVLLRVQINSLYPYMKPIHKVDNGISQISYGIDIHTGIEDTEQRPSSKQEEYIMDMLEFVQNTLDGKRHWKIK